REDTSVGQLFVVRSTDTFYVALEDEFAVITELQARLLETSTGEQLAEMHSSEVGSQSPTQELLPENLHEGLAVPPTSGQLNTVSANSRKAACAIFNPYHKTAGRPPQMAYDVSLGISDSEGAITKETGEQGDTLASRVVVNPGKGAFVRAGSQLCLVTDTGKYYTVPSEEEMQLLGYLAGTPIGRLPSSLVARLPRGPALDREDALQETQE
ncbi:MAG: type VII secretion protein EccB, partial [Micromonosporaceae bacterium]